MSVKVLKETKGEKTLLPGQFSYELSEVCILGKCCVIVQLPADALVPLLLGLLGPLGLLRAHPQLSALLSNARGLEQIKSLNIVRSYDRGNDWVMKDILVLMSLHYASMLCELCVHCECELDR